MWISFSPRINRPSVLERSAKVDLVCETVGGIVNVFFGPGFDELAFFGGKNSDDFRGRAKNHATGGESGVLGDEGVGSDDAMFADLGAVQNGRAHADEALITDSAGMDDGGMANGDPIAQNAGMFIGKMKDGVVLDVGVVSDNDAVDVAAQDGVIPNAGVIAESDVAENDGAARDVNAFAKRRLAAQEGVELLSKFRFWFAHGTGASGQEHS